MEVRTCFQKKTIYGGKYFFFGKFVAGVDLKLTRGRALKKTVHK
jgi:hypothetical protein